VTRAECEARRIVRARRDDLALRHGEQSRQRLLDGRDLLPPEDPPSELGEPFRIRVAKPCLVREQPEEGLHAQAVLVRVFAWQRPGDDGVDQVSPQHRLADEGTGCGPIPSTRAQLTRRARQRRDAPHPAQLDPAQRLDSQC
jgi:hypothetical protein